MHFSGQWLMSWLRKCQNANFMPNLLMRQLIPMLIFKTKLWRGRWPFLLPTTTPRTCVTLKMPFWLWDHISRYPSLHVMVVGWLLCSMAHWYTYDGWLQDRYIGQIYLQRITWPDLSWWCWLDKRADMIVSSGH